jgi:hypothetical protein
MENNDHNIPQIVSDIVVGREINSPDELSAEMNEQEKDEQIIRFEEDLTSNF